MIVGILSDTHNQQARTELAVQTLKSNGATSLFHCGDLVQPPIVAACAVLPCCFVFGNNDAGNIAALRSAIADIPSATCLEWGGEMQLAGKRIAVTHGHLPQEVRRLLKAGPDYLFSGHSHRAADWIEGTTRRINPGALHRATRFTVAELNLENGELQFLEIPR